eukprot:gene27765-34533_t
MGYLAAHYDSIKKNFTEDEMVLRHVRQRNTVFDRLKQASIKHGRPVTQQQVILDLKDLPLAPDTMTLSVMRRNLAIDDAYYPGLVDKILFINAPFHFSVIWAIFKPLIGAEALSRIQILGANYKDVLRALIADDELPVEYGGSKSDFAWRYPENNIGYNEE